MGTTEDSKALMWRITDEIWNNGRLELIDELIAQDLIDHVELAGLEGTGRGAIEPASKSRVRRSRTMGTHSISCWPTVRSPFPTAVPPGPIAASSWGYRRPDGLLMYRHSASCGSPTVKPSNDGAGRTTWRCCNSSG